MSPSSYSRPSTPVAPPEKLTTDLLIKHFNLAEYLVFHGRWVPCHPAGDDGGHQRTRSENEGVLHAVRAQHSVGLWNVSLQVFVIVDRTPVVSPAIIECQPAKKKTVDFLFN